MIVPWNIVELELDFHGHDKGQSRQGIRPHVRPVILTITSGLGPATRISANTVSSWNVSAIGGNGKVLKRFL